MFIQFPQSSQIFHAIRMKGLRPARFVQNVGAVGSHVGQKFQSVGAGRVFLTIREAASGQPERNRVTSRDPLTLLVVERPRNLGRFLA